MDVWQVLGILAVYGCIIGVIAVVIVMTRRRVGP